MILLLRFVVIIFLHNDFPYFLKKTFFVLRIFSLINIVEYKWIWQKKKSMSSNK